MTNRDSDVCKFSSIGLLERLSLGGVEPSKAAGREGSAHEVCQNTNGVAEDHFTIPLLPRRTKAVLESPPLSSNSQPCSIELWLTAQPSALRPSLCPSETNQTKTDFFEFCF